MVQTHLTKRWGGGGTNPTLDELRSALAELDARDPEHPDCWLFDDGGWTIAAHEGGLIVFENVETGEGPWHLSNASRELVVELWLGLQRGDLTAIRQRAWLDGYGTRAAVEKNCKSTHKRRSAARIPERRLQRSQRFTP